MRASSTTSAVRAGQGQPSASEMHGVDETILKSNQETPFFLFDLS